jgi:hypothetical protein
VLETGKVLAVGGVLGNPGGDVVPVVVAPSGVREVGVLVADALLVDLEPVAGSVIGLDVVVRGPREIDETGTCVRDVSVGNLSQTRRNCWFLTRVAEFAVGSQPKADLIAGLHSQDLGAASTAEGALVAARVGAVDGRAITEIGRRVARELDGVVLRLPAGLADVLVGGLGDAVDDVRVEPVVGGDAVGHEGAEQERGELHLESAKGPVLRISRDQGWMAAGVKEVVEKTILVILILKLHELSTR